MTEVSSSLFKSALVVSLVVSSLLLSGPVNATKAPGKPEIFKFTCKGGATEFYQDEANKHWGIGRTPYYLRCTAPDFAGATVGLDAKDLDAYGSFNQLTLVFEDEGSTSLPNTTARFLFKLGKQSLTIEKPLSQFKITKIDKTRFQEAYITSKDFKEPDYNYRCSLSRLTLLLKSGGSKQHKIVFGRLYIDGMYDGSPKNIVFDDEGCSPVDANQKSE